MVASSPLLGPSLARSREARFACPNRRACPQASIFRTLTGEVLTVHSRLCRSLTYHWLQWPDLCKLCQITLKSNIEKFIKQAVLLHTVEPQYNKPLCEEQLIFYPITVKCVEY